MRRSFYPNTKQFLLVTSLILAIIQAVFAQQIETVHTLSETGAVRSGRSSFALDGNGDAFVPVLAIDPTGNPAIRLVGLNDTIEAPFLPLTGEDNWYVDPNGDWISPDVPLESLPVPIMGERLLNLQSAVSDSQSRFLVGVSGLNTDSHTILVESSGAATSWSHSDRIQWNSLTSEYGAVGGTANAVHLNTDNGLITEIHGAASAAYDIAGDVAVGHVGHLDDARAVQWEREGDGWNLRELPGVENCAWSNAVGVNDAGEIIGFCVEDESFDSPVSPLFWDAEGNLNADLESSIQLTQQQMYLREDGTVVGLGENGAFEWSESTGVTPLHLDHTGIGFSLTSIDDANDLGEVVVVDFSSFDPVYAVASKTNVSAIEGDFNRDGLRSEADLNQLLDVMSLNAETFALFDLDANGSIDDADVDAWRAIESRFALADLDENGVIDSVDLGRLLNNFGSTTGELADGNLNDDQIIDSTDLGLMLNLFGRESTSINDPVAVPEPSLVMLLATGLIMLTMRGEWLGHLARARR